MNPQKTKVILVGNVNFPKWGGEIKDIPNVEQNMESLKKIFFDKNYFGIPNDKTHFIEIKDESSQEILLRVKHETKSSTQKEDFEKLIFYYSGHGIPGEDGKLFFAARDTIRSDYEITSVDSRRLFSYLKGFKAKQLIVILDCCYAAQTKENMGDADTLIENSLPKDKLDLEPDENGAYYLFASGKDNVAKFNPLEPGKPTYFTEALLCSIEKGTEPGKDFVTMGELFKQLREEINRLKKSANPDIPDPRPVLEGDVNGIYFCKNTKFETKEDKDWAELLKDPTFEGLENFQNEYPASRYEFEINALQGKLIEGWDEIKKANEKNDKSAALKIKSTFRDIPIIYNEADKLLKQMVAKYKEFEKEARAGIAVRDTTEASPRLQQAMNSANANGPDKSSLQDSSSLREERNKLPGTP